MLGEGQFLKGKWEYMYTTGNLGKNTANITAYASLNTCVYMGIMRGMVRA